MNNKEELVRNWLIKSKRDLLAAQKLSQEEDLYGDVAIYHCQQSAEKAVKGFLSFHDQKFLNPSLNQVFASQFESYSKYIHCSNIVLLLSKHCHLMPQNIKVL